MSRFFLFIMQNNWKTEYPLLFAAEYYTKFDARKVQEGVGSPLFTGVMAFVMGIVTMIRVTRNMPRKLTDATLYSKSAVYCDGDASVKDHVQKAHVPSISGAEYLAVMKRMAELEERAIALSMQPAMPPEKEEMLNAALSRVDALEQELMATKKVLIPYRLVI